MAPNTRLILALLGITSLGVLLCASLIYGSLDRLSLRTAEANIDFLLSQQRDAIEASAGLGLPLADARIVQDLIERAKAGDEQVLALEVFAPDGVSLFNTDRGSIGESIPSSWREAVRYRIEKDRWRVDEFGNIVVGQPIRNDFGETIGQLAVTISGQSRQEHSEAVLVELARWTAIVLAIALVLALAVSALILKRSNRDLRDLASRLSSDTGTPDVPRGADVRRAAADTVERLDRATADVLALDESEARDAA